MLSTAPAQPSSQSPPAFLLSGFAVARTARRSLHQFPGRIIGDGHVHVPYFAALAPEVLHEHPRTGRSLLSPAPRALHLPIALEAFHALFFLESGF
jgi:hypothetical protein